ncbi:MAG: hypothetical protein Q9217_002015 [Psora testacea]
MNRLMDAEAASDGLCAVCENINIVDLFNPEDDALSHHRLKTWDEIQRETQCSFCDLIRELVQIALICHPEESLRGDQELAVVNRSSLSERRHKDSNAGDSNKKLAALYVGLPYHPKFPETLQICLAAKDSPPDRPLFQGRLVRQEQMDFSLVHGWLDRCQRTHEKCNSLLPSSSQGRKYLRLIDVYARKVIPAPQGSVYVALSYVWGTKLLKKPTFRACKADFTVETAEDGNLAYILNLPEKLPQSIEDAIQLVQDVRHRYLWVDALCIIQDDAKDQRLQIENMCNIYRNAYFTIIAATAITAESDLPGVRRGTRNVWQLCRTIKGRKLITTLPDMPRDDLDVMDVPAPLGSWRYRAWTFQEAILSTRCLILTENEVFFECREESFSESVKEPPEGMAAVRKHGVFSNPLDHLAIWYSNADAQASDRNQRAKDLALRKWDFRIYGILVREYLARELSFLSDSHRAFFGVETYLREQCGVSFLWGMPEVDFDRALLWKPKARCEMIPSRPDYPTWSWIGWFGDVGHGIQKYNVGGGQVNVDEPGPIRLCGARYWKVPLGSEPVNLGTPPQDEDGDHNPSIHQPCENYILAASWTIRVRLDNLSSSQWGSSEYSPNEEGLCILSGDMTPVSLVIHRIDLDTQRLLANTICEFMLLSECLDPEMENNFFNIAGSFGVDKAYRDLSQGRWDWTHYNVMLLDWEGDSARCVGITAIPMDLWHAAGPVGKLIKLK